MATNPYLRGPGGIPLVFLDCSAVLLQSALPYLLYLLVSLLLFFSLPLCPMHFGGTYIF